MLLHVRFSSEMEDYKRVVVNINEPAARMSVEPVSDQKVLWCSVMV